jgi:hypothetical protein
MLHVILPAQYLQRAGERIIEPRKRLMLAVLQAVVDDCNGTAYKKAAAFNPPVDPRARREAIAYIESTDRSWPFSFENLCEAIGVDAGMLRKGLVGDAPAVRAS